MSQTLPTVPRGVTCRAVGKSFSIQWRDPVTRKRKERRLRTDERSARLWAAAQHERNEAARTRRTRQQLKAEILGVVLDAVAPEHKRTIAEEVSDYYAWLAKPAKRSKDTTRNAEEAFFMLLSWCERHGIVYLRELTGSELHKWWDHLNALRKRNGQPYKISTINQWLKYPRRMLRRAAGLQRAPQLNSDVLRESLPHTSIAKATDKTMHGIETARALRVQEIKLLLRTALEYDARDRTLDRVSRSGGTERARPAAPDIAMLLLTGLRRREYTYMPCADVHYSTSDKAAVIELKGERAKGYAPRLVEMRGVTLIGSELVLALKREDDEWLSLYAYQELDDVLRTLHKRGGPKCTSHDLRATCATYQLAVHKLDLFRATKRLGHTPSIAKESYLQPLPGMAFGAKSLEAAMGCEAEFKLIVKALKAWASTSPERKERRPMPSRPQTQALLSKDPNVLRDALARWSAKRK